MGCEEENKNDTGLDIRSLLSIDDSMRMIVHIT